MAKEWLDIRHDGHRQGAAVRKDSDSGLIAFVRIQDAGAHERELSITGDLVKIHRITCVIDFGIRREERQLEQVFGRAWQDYKKRVRRWLQADVKLLDGNDGGP